MREILFELGLFQSSSAAERAASERVLAALLAALLVADVEYLRLNPRTPRIYTPGLMRYERELLPNEIAAKFPQCATPCKAPVHPEHWKGIAACLRDREGDCEDLACWRASELIVRDRIAARPDFSFKKVGTLMVYHIFVRLPDGTIDDPSRRLGMV